MKRRQLVLSLAAASLATGLPAARAQAWPEQFHPTSGKERLKARAEPAGVSRISSERSTT